MKSYTSRPTTLPLLLQEAVSLYRTHVADISGHVRHVISDLKLLEADLQKRYELTLRDLDILDIGTGQFLIQLFYFSRCNQAVGIDWNLIAQGMNPARYLKMFVVNGPRRTAKTIGRKLLGIDRRYRAAIAQQLALPTLPPCRVHQMDACNMTFPDESFDFVHSYSVFHHLADSGAGLSEVVRILRPGGVAYISLHLFASENGFLGPLLKDQRGEIILWPHLRPQFADKVVSHAYLNKLRLSEWRTLFQTKMSGVEIVVTRSPRPGIEEDAKSLLERGEILDYSLEELLTHDLSAFWRKPSPT
jgi:SAM-dependent methyltransferase